MRKLFYIMVLPILTSCVFIPSSWFNGGRGFEANRSAANSYTILPPPPDVIYQGEEIVVQKNYVLNQNTVAKVGDTVIRVQAFKKESYVVGQFVLETPVEVNFDIRTMTLPAKTYPIFGTFEKDGKPYYVLPKMGPVYFLLDMEGILQNWYLYEIKNSDKVTLFNDKLKLSPRFVQFTRKLEQKQSRLPFEDYEIVYDGIKADQISLFYKNQVPGSNGSKGSFDTLMYPENATMISVKGRLLRVVRADNEQMTYVVIKE